MIIGQSKELIVKEKAAPEDDEGEPMTEEGQEKATEGEEEKSKEEAKVEEKTQPEMLLLTSVPKVRPSYNNNITMQCL